jgi:hypothetical protein
MPSSATSPSPQDRESVVVKQNELVQTNPDANGCAAGFPAAPDAATESCPAPKRRKSLRVALIDRTQLALRAEQAAHLDEGLVSGNPSSEQQRKTSDRALRVG